MYCLKLSLHVLYLVLKVSWLGVSQNALSHSESLWEVLPSLRVSQSMPECSGSIQNTLRNPGISQSVSALKWISWWESKHRTDSGAAVLVSSTKVGDRTFPDKCYECGRKEYRHFECPNCKNTPYIKGQQHQQIRATTTSTVAVTALSDTKVMAQAPGDLSTILALVLSLVAKVKNMREELGQFWVLKEDKHFWFGPHWLPRALNHVLWIDTMYYEPWMFTRLTMGRNISTFQYDSKEKDSRKI